MALHEGSVFVNGQPKDTNLDTYRLLRMGDTPEVEVEFLPSTEAPVGLGEPWTTAVAPAIGNAIFAAAGVLVRHLPIRPQGPAGSARASDLTHRSDTPLLPCNAPPKRVVELVTVSIMPAAYERSRVGREVPTGNQ